MAHIVVADENPAPLEFLGGIFARAGHWVTSAHSADEALAVLRSSLHPVVLFARSVYDPAHLPPDVWLAWRAREHDDPLEPVFAELAMPVLYLPIPPEVLLGAVAEAEGRLARRG
jgi:CheY-like chemotaxis protein